VSTGRRLYGSPDDLNLCCILITKEEIKQLSLSLAVLFLQLSIKTTNYFSPPQGLDGDMALALFS
jgi:hypothetical protein